MVRRGSLFWVLSLATAVVGGVLADVGLTRHSMSHGFTGSDMRTISGLPDVTTYNCAGLALGNYRRMSLDQVRQELGGFRELSRADAPCPAGWVKIWAWEYDVHHETEDGWVEEAHRDGHMVAGRTSGVDGSGPAMVYCKYGLGPVQGPGAPESWAPPGREVVGRNRFGKRVFVVRENMVERWYCAPPDQLGH
jgi:hypothetical protein